MEVTNATCRSAAYIANYGFITLALPFYGVNGLRQTYTEKDVKIEYFEEVLTYLQLLEEVQSDRIGVLGHSKGGEIAFAMMSFLPQVKAVYTTNVQMSTVLVDTTYKNKQVSKVPYDAAKIKVNDDGSVIVRDTVA